MEKYRLRFSENRVPRRIFGHKKEEVTGERRKLHNEVHHNLYSPPNIIRMIKSQRIQYAGDVEWHQNPENLNLKNQNLVFFFTGSGHLVSCNSEIIRGSEIHSCRWMISAVEHLYHLNLQSWKTVGLLRGGHLDEDIDQN